jgi:hypothetical protein
MENATAPAAQSAVPANLSQMSISDIARLVRKDWGSKVNYAARPYLEAMGTMEKITDNYGADRGKDIVLYFLSNATSWRGEVAKHAVDRSVILYRFYSPNRKGKGITHGYILTGGYTHLFLGMWVTGPTYKSHNVMNWVKDYVSETAVEVKAA